MNTIKKKTKNLYIHHGWGIGGAPISLLYLLKELDKKKYDIRIVCLYRSEASELFEKNGFKVIFATQYNCFFAHHEKGKIKIYNIYRIIKTIYHWFMTAYSLAPKILDYNKPDIIHLNSDVLSSWAFAAKKLDLKVICHIRDPIARGILGVRRNILRRILNSSVHHFIAISKDNAERLDIKNKTTVVYNFVDFNKFNIELTKNQKKSGTKKILFLGGMHKAKGFNILVDALKYLNENIQVILCGYYQNSRTLKSLFNPMQKKIKIANNLKNVKILGVVNDIQNVIATCDIVVFPATIPHFARPIIEAGAMGKPVIASKLPGMEELVIPNKTGLLVKPNNAFALAMTINDLCSDESKRTEMGENAYQRATELFDSKKNTRQIEAIYDSML